MRRYVVILISVLLLLIFVNFLSWYFLIKSVFDVILATSISFFLTIAGIVIDRLFSNKERRRELLVALIHENYMNLNVLNDPLYNNPLGNANSPIIFPRVFLSTLETVIASGAFIGDDDKKLFRLMHEWKEFGGDFNRRLDATDYITLNKISKKEIQAVYAKIPNSNILMTTKNALSELAICLMNDYSKESKITTETVLFG